MASKKRGFDERLRQYEQVIVLLRTEGEEVAKPDDTQCRALRGKSRCKNQISYDEEGDNWSVFCKEHREKDNTAREEGGARVVRFDRTEEKVEAEA